MQTRQPLPYRQRLPLLLVIMIYLLGIISPVFTEILFPSLFRTTAPVEAQIGTLPILVVVNQAAPQKYGRYLGEILRAEGLNSFEIVELADLTASALTAHDLTILAETPLSADQATLFTNHVNGGGRLIAMRPDEQIASLFGLNAPSAPITDPYLKILNNATLNNSQPGAGLSGETLQVHGVADRYSLLSGAIPLAQLYFDASQASSFAAIVSNSTGNAIAYNYDLAQNIVYTRQGNPANANVDVDGDLVLRTIDLFQGQNGADPWIDRTKIPLPQADIQQRYFARLVSQLVSEVRPMPQLWYFPGQQKTMLLLTGDAHGSPTSTFQQEINSINAHNGRITLYLSIAGEPNTASLQTWMAQGHTFGIHPYWYSENSYEPFDIDNLVEGYDVYDSWYTMQHNNLPPSLTVRHHQVAWLGWTDAAALEAQHGYALDANFYHWGPWIKIPGGEWPHGYMTGSGQSMKFITADGTILPVYQQLTQLVDEHLVTSGHWEQLTDAQGVEVSKELIDASQAGNYAAIMTQFHLEYYGDIQEWAEGTMAYANSLDIPIWNADEWLSFVQTRHDAEFTNITWNATTSQLSFNLQAATSEQTLTVLLPLTYANKHFNSLVVNGNAASYQSMTISGRELAAVTVPAGNHGVTITYGDVANTPTPTQPSNATSTPTPTATPTNTPPNAPTNTPTNTPTSTPIVSSPSVWTHVPGNCNSSLGGAVFAIVTSGCGGSATTFDATETFAPAILRDVATEQAPCPGIAGGATCYRMWYVGETNESSPKLGYAVSPDGIAWTRVAGAGTGGSVFGAGAPGGFDSSGAAYPSVIKDGNTFKMWYIGYGSSNYVEGVGYATSQDGITWQRQSGPLAGGAVMLPTHQNGTFDRDTVNTPYVIKDRATATLPCTNVATGDTCYRMWYEGANDESGYRFKIGYATSPDGLTWTRAWDQAESSDHSVLNITPFGNFDENSVGVPAVLKEGATLHMWYEAKDYESKFTIGHATSTDGIHWLRSTPNTPIWTGANDPGNFTPDDVWTPSILKELSQYRMWYSASTQPFAQRIGLAGTTPGSTLTDLTIEENSAGMTVAFETTSALPEQSSVLLTLPAHVNLIGTSGFNLNGFGSSATITVDPNAISDAAAMGVARAAIVIRLPNGAPAGAKSIAFQLPGSLPAPGQLLVQTFSHNYVAEYGVVDLPFSGPTATPTNTPTATPVEQATSTPTNTPVPPTNTPAATATDTPSPTPTPNAGDVTHTTVNHFAQSCVESNGVVVSSAGGGSLSLAGQVHDAFSATNLNTSLWDAGSWSGGSFNPTFADDAIVLPAGSSSWTRSDATFTRSSMEAVATFGNGAWQHLGFASHEFEGNRYFIFSTVSGDGYLYARVNNNGDEQRVNLGTIPAGSHRYRIDWTALNGTTDQVTFWIDGTQVAQMNTSNTGASNFYLYLSNNGSSALSVSDIDVAPTHLAGGTYTSCVLDAGADHGWQSAAWDASTPANTSLTVEVRTSLDSLAWGNWSALNNAAGSSIPTLGRYAQYRLSLGTSNTATGPQLNSITLNQAAAQLPTPTNTPLPTATNTPVPTATDTPLPTATNTPLPTATDTPLPTATDTPLPTATDTPLPTATDTPLPTATDTPVPTATNTPLPTATNTPVPTATPTFTPTPESGSVSHTSVVDFSESCVVVNGATIDSAGGGSLSLAGQVHDAFSATNLNTSLWDAGSWSGGSFNPTFADDAIVLPAGSSSWTRSDATFTRSSMEAVATFGNGAWQHLGFASHEFEGNRYFIFSTVNGDGYLYARVNNNGSEQRVNLGTIPADAHRYRIDWLALDGSTDQVTFWIDGTQVAQMNTSNTGASNFYLYLSNSGSAALSVAEADVAPAHVASGIFTSCVLDAGADHGWQSAAWDASTPVDTSLTVQVRTSLDSLTWGEWSTLSNATGSAIPTLGRYAQYQLSFATSDPTNSAQLNSITLDWASGE